MKNFDLSFLAQHSHLCPHSLTLELKKKNSDQSIFQEWAMLLQNFMDHVGWKYIFQRC